MVIPAALLVPEPPVIEGQLMVQGDKTDNPGQFVNDPPLIKVDEIKALLPTDMPEVNDDDPPSIEEAVIVAFDPVIDTPKLALAVPPRIVSERSVQLELEITKQVLVPAKTLDVSVTPADIVKEPPVVAPFALSVRICPVNPRSFETLTVMANEFAMRTSPLANVTAAAVPLGAVAHTSAALMLPALRAK
jgi:hypothetical protein